MTISAELRFQIQKLKIFGSICDNFPKLFVPLHRIHRKIKDMLGIDSKETPIVTGVYADEIREAVRRAHLGQFIDSDRKVAARSASIKQEYDAVWK
jgi:hypothetical protein